LISKSRDGGRRVELVIEGKAFERLNARRWLENYLGECRVFARMTPLNKVQCVRMHMRHHITAMCGDGGNDAGALKAAHAGIALTGSGSSVVSHFSSNNFSIMSCVDLIREARCSLDVSLASYKTLIMYGEIVVFSTFAQYFFSVQMSQAFWVFIDTCAVPLSWALTSALPAAQLSNSRPTARLLGFETIGSVVGQIVINSLFLIVTLAILFEQSFFVCNEFDPVLVDLRKWWEMSDNFEGVAIGFLTAFQILNSACAFSMGNKYRKGFFKNGTFMAVYFVLATMLVAIILSDPNPIGCFFRVNCGTQEALTILGYTPWFNTPEEYFNAPRHNVMPIYFRLTLVLIALLNLFAVLIWEGAVILGPGREKAKEMANGRWQIKKQSVIV